MLKVNRRNGFSDRNGIASITTNIQLDDFDERTRNRLLNLVNSVYNDTFEGEEFFSKNKKDFFVFIFDDVYAAKISFDVGTMKKEGFAAISETILKDKHCGKI